MRERTLSELNSRKVEKKTENKNKNLHMPNGKQVENGYHIFVILSSACINKIS